MVYYRLADPHIITLLEVAMGEKGFLFFRGRTEGAHVN